MRTIFFCLVTCLLGLSIGLMVNLHVVGDFVTPPAENTPSTSQSVIAVQAPVTKTAAEKSHDESDGAPLEVTNEGLLKQSFLVLRALKEQDYPAFAQLVHPSKGVRFTPFSTVDKEADRYFKQNELSKAKEDTTLYIWGLQDGSGLPIQLSIQDYIKKFVYNADYASAPQIGINTLFSSGNSLENVAEAYPDCHFVEFYFPEIDPKNNGFDWCGLKLVFEPVGQSYQLVGIIHSEWTI